MPRLFLPYLVAIFLAVISLAQSGSTGRNVSASLSATPTPWHLDRIDQRSLPLDGAFSPVGLGCGVTIYVLDTGIRITHDAFFGRADYAPLGHDGDLLGDDFGLSRGADDCHGHGTHMAALAAGYPFGLAPCADIRSVRVADCHGRGRSEAAVRAVDWITLHAARPALVLMSLNYEEAPALRAAVSRSMANGIPYVVAAGGSFTDACHSTPAGIPGAITVAASTREDRPLPFGNYGPCVDLYAPGQAILSAGVSSDTATMRREGTSTAAAVVAGAAALYLEQYPDATPYDVETALVDSATTGALKLTGRAALAHTPNRLLFVGGGALSMDISGREWTSWTRRGCPSIGKASASTPVHQGPPSSTDSAPPDNSQSSTAAH